jgi:hypothetical protein
MPVGIDEAVLPPAEPPALPGGDFPNVEAESQGSRGHFIFDGEAVGLGLMAQKASRLKPRKPCSRDSSGPIGPIDR